MEITVAPPPEWLVFAFAVLGVARILFSGYRLFASQSEQISRERASLRRTEESTILALRVAAVCVMLINVAWAWVTFWALTQLKVS
jgi:hypothetical protein